MLTSMLLLGFGLGIRHAFEADHLAAVSALLSRGRGVSEMARHGATWGAGHTLALLAISGFVLFTPWSLPANFGPVLETVVGLMLVGLGVNVIYGLAVRRELDSAVDLKNAFSRGVVLTREPDHAHRRGIDQVHMPADGHLADTDYEHQSSWRTLAVGLTHGAAGSAALVVYLAASLESPWIGLVYVLLFGLGSVLGMSLLSMVIALPLTATAKTMKRGHLGLQMTIAIASIAVGVNLVAHQASALW